MSIRVDARIVVLALAAACGRETLPPDGQLLVRLDTDAPLPSRDPSAPPALFDRARVEIFPPGADKPCAGCTREIAVEAELWDAGRASFGFVESAPAPRYRVRARLFRAAYLVDGEPPVATAIETVASLPETPREGVIGVTVQLKTDDLAKPRGTLAAPVAPEPADAPKLAPWEGARRTSCASAPGEGEACVPGGAYWMGDPAIATLDPALFDGDGVRVVALSPFFVDLHEVTVGQWRAAFGDPRVSQKDPAPYSAETNPECTLTIARGPNEDKPLVCISYEAARDFCASRGKMLPSEARFEYVASGLTGAPYVWGNDPPGCGDAVYARNPTGVDRTKACLKPPDRSGVAKVGSGARDAIALVGGSVVDLAGNVSEWTADDYRKQTDPACWGSGVFRDPVCTVASRDQSMRGGNWTLFDLALRPQLRFSDSKPTHPLTSVGFRCVRDGR